MVDIATGDVDDREPTSEEQGKLSRRVGLGYQLMTGAQASYLKALSEECGELAPDLTKPEASNALMRLGQSAVPTGLVIASRAFANEAEDKLEDFPDPGSPRIATPGSDHKQRCAGRPPMREVCYWRARRASTEVGRHPPEVDPASFGATVKLWPRTNPSDRRRG